MIHLAALGGAISISFSAVFVRLAGVSPDTSAFFRTLYALPVLFLVWLALHRGDTRTRGERALAFASGALLALDLAFWHRSIRDIGAGLATVLGNTQVAFVGVAGWAIYRERPTREAFALLPAVFLGVLLISGVGTADAFGSDPVSGAIFGVLTGLAYAGFLLVFRSSNRRRLPVAGPLLDATAGAALGLFVVGLIFDPGFSVETTWPAHGWLLALAMVSQVLGYLLIAVALPRLPALETSVMLLLQPMLAVLWGFLIFDEVLSPLQWGGVLLVLSGIVVLTTRGSVQRVAPEAEGEPGPVIEPEPSGPGVAG